MAYSIRQGNSGIEVSKLQSYLIVLRQALPDIPFIQVDGMFGSMTTNAIRAFQRAHDLTVDGVVGTSTWDQLIYQFLHQKNSLVNEKPAAPLQLGSTGLAVQKFQHYLNVILKPQILLVEDGIYGKQTQAAVLNFQNESRLIEDGLIGNKTWNEIIAHPNMS